MVILRRPSDVSKKKYSSLTANIIQQIALPEIRKNSLSTRASYLILLTCFYTFAKAAQGIKRWKSNFN